MRDTSHTFGANDNGRNSSASLNGSTAGTYLYNAFEQRVQKVAGGVTTQFVFDRFGHLLEEANGSGTVQKEYIWLDDLPVAMVDATTNTIYFIHTDQLGTPQKITDGAANIVWDGLFDPFGNAITITGANWGTGVWGSFNWAPTSPPIASTNLRFPGQYADAETQLSQNWNRDYDASIGRYIESDPIGLWGRINTYGYASESPAERFDPTGLFDPRPLTAAERIALGEEIAGGGPEDPFADLGAALTLGIGLAIAASSPDIASIPDGGGIGNNQPPSKGGTGGCDPCRGLRDILAEHRQKLSDYLSNPAGFDNKGFLGKGRDQKVISGRIRNLQNQISNFQKQLEECERQHGKGS